MSEILVQYNEVYSQVAMLRGRIVNMRSEVDSDYAQIQSMLEGLDSASNATYQAAMEQNKGKALAFAEALDQLLMAIVASSQRVESEEGQIAGTFQSGGGS